MICPSLTKLRVQFETVPGTYEDIPSSSSREVIGQYEYTQIQAYATTTMSGRKHGN